MARRAGISAEWYVKLEQGRAVSPSAATVEALGRALRLDAVELAHLRSLAAPAGRPPFRAETVPPALRRLVASLPEPAYLTGERFDLLAWNEAATALFGDWGALAPDHRNILHWMLSDPMARVLFADRWEAEARRLVSLFRANHDLRAGDAAFAHLVDRLREVCPEFGAWWAAHAVAAPLGGSKTLHHPTLGTLRFDHASFQANDDRSLKLALYTRRGPG